jgi:predicted glycogen debranching enzyme
MISFASDICTDFEQASSREWLETNGIGGFASATVAGSNSRRYHGLLAAAIDPPVGRAVLLSKFEEAFTVGKETFLLSANQYPGAVYPQGYRLLKNFRQGPFPIWTFEAAGVELEKCVFMVHGENTTVITYSIKDQKPGDEIKLEIKPLAAFRDYHHLGHERAVDHDLTIGEGRVSIRPVADMPELYFAHTEAQVERTGEWYRNFEYEIERERGFDFHEDLFNPFVLRFDLSDPKEISIIVSTEPREVSDALSFRLTEIARREALLVQANAKDEFTRQLAVAADQFLVARGTEKTVIAGYYWFTDWGRDTMIALPGLTLATNRFEAAESILLEFSKHISQGMLPNRFPDVGEEPEYNTADATLWYFEAIRAYTKAAKDQDFVKRNLYEKLRDIVEWHVRGTRYGIKADPADGLLSAGEEGVQLTWMDAKIGDWVVTPRAGKAVEIQALWHNALRIMEHFAGLFEDEENKTKYQAMADLAVRNFENAFWNEDEQCLYDVINDGEKDGSVRPNQVFAVSLPYTMLSPEKAQKVVEKTAAELLTPVGLRSLSPKDPRYVPVYSGSPLRRDGSYHQGTVWGWLIGPYITAHQKVFGVKNLAEMLKGFEAHLTEAGLGTISEIFDGDAPHTPRGCIAQAWSVAELLRVLSEG